MDKKILEFQLAFNEFILVIEKISIAIPKSNPEYMRWFNLIIPNLHQYRELLEHSISKYNSGEIQSIVQFAASCTGLSKDLDIQTAWMPSETEKIFCDLLRKIITLASEIHKDGYKLLHG